MVRSNHHCSPISASRDTTIWRNSKSNMTSTPHQLLCHVKIPAIQIHSRITNLGQFNYCKLHLLLETINKLEKERILHRNKHIYKILWSMNLEHQVLSFARVNTKQGRALPFVSCLQDFLPDYWWGWCKQHRQTTLSPGRKKKIQIYAQVFDTVIYIYIRSTIHLFIGFHFLCLLNQELKGKEKLKACGNVTPIPLWSKRLSKKTSQKQPPLVKTFGYKELNATGITVLQHFL